MPTLQEYLARSGPGHAGMTIPGAGPAPSSAPKTALQALAAPKKSPPPQEMSPLKPPSVASGGSGGGTSGAAATMGNFTPPAPTTFNRPSFPEPAAPQEAAQNPLLDIGHGPPAPTLFDFGGPVAANPALGHGNPAMEGLLASFRRKPIY